MLKKVVKKKKETTETPELLPFQEDLKPTEQRKKVIKKKKPVDPDPKLNQGEDAPKEPSKKDVKAKKEKEGDKKPKSKVLKGSKYIYPEDCTSKSEQKKFRNQVRLKLKKFTADLSKLDQGSKSYKKLEQEAMAYQKSVIKEIEDAR